jgi:outer membrane protein assembly factor BamB
MRTDLTSSSGWQGRLQHGGWAIPWVAFGLAVAVAALVISRPGRSVAVAQEVAEEEEEGEEEPFEEGGAYLPTDRITERRLDFARRLIADQRWSDAVTLLDEVLASDRDSFFRSDVAAATWRSAKAEAALLLANLPAAGNEAYQLQFRAKADRELADALAIGDDRGIAAVARRWLNTPAGQRATLLAALEALDQGQPLAAAAWLDRLAAGGGDELEPTLSVMRAVAWQRAGDARAAREILDQARTGTKTTLRLGGRDVTVSFAPSGGEAWLAGIVGPPPAAAVRAAEEWCMHRGDPPRNAVVDASRPLLVPRYRVPLTRHPEEAKWLEARRQRAADRDGLLLPAATPLAVEGTVVLHTPMGLLAVDFETGKRLWLQPGGAAGPVTLSEDPGDEDETTATAIAQSRMLAPVFEDATSGTLASDGQLVFAVESHPDALVSRDLMGPRGQIMFNGGATQGGWSGGNSLAAYDLSDRGRLRWRLPMIDPGRPTRAMAWTLGAPLPVNDRLFVLVEELGEVRLDVLDADTGSTVWTQPLAELDEEARVDNQDNQPRRVAGLSPALAEGVLVCPTGAGAVVAVDLATRTLLWAYNYRISAAGDMVVMRNGVRVPQVGRIINGRVVVRNGQSAGPEGRWLDGCPVVAGGSVILTPGESDQLHCLDLRTGAVKWTKSRDDGLYVAGAVGDRLVIVGRRGVEAVDINSAERLWSAPLTADGAAISGRGLVVADRMFVPLDTPEVVEIDLATGRIAGRSPGRGGAVPGNLVAYRGEVLSQGVDSLDVFHQTAPLEARIETALREAPNQRDDAWSMMWQGQLQLDRGEVAAGLANLRAAEAAAPGRFSPDMLPAALVHALEEEPAIAETVWPELLRLDPSPTLVGRGLRLAVDSLVAAGRLSQAWQACRQLMERTAAAAVDNEPERLVPDGRDPLLMVRESRWIQSRVSEIQTRGAADLREEIGTFADTMREAIKNAEAPPADRRARLDRFIEWFGHDEVAAMARRDRVDAVRVEAEAGGTDEAAARSLEVRRELAMIDMARWGTPEDRRLGAVEIERSRAALGGLSNIRIDEAWPRGRVVVTPGKTASGNEGRRPQPMRTLPLRVTAGSDSLLPGARVEFDMQRGGLIVRDALGRMLGEPITLQQQRHHGWGVGGFNAAAADVTILGRVAIVQSGGFLAAYELAGPATLGRGAGHRELWTHDTGLPPRTVSIRRGINGQFPRNGNVPLGMPIPEPHAGGMVAPGTAAATISGVPVLVDGLLQLCDPLTGRVVWERHRVADVATLFGDDDYLCLCPANGRAATLVSMATGAVVRTCDLPDRERRLLTHGRHVFALMPQASSEGTSGRRMAETVNLEVIDPATMQRIVLGGFSGQSRATLAGEDLAILEPSGMLTIISLESRRVAFTTRLPEMPQGLERLVVLPWQDRYLVIAGRPKTAAETKYLEKIGTIGPLPQMRSPSMLGDGQPLTGSIWAIDRLDGDMLWPAPATILHHCLCASEAEAVPVLLFARQIETRRGGERPRLSVLCLDKRTGAAVHADDTILAPQHMLFGCDLVGDPATHTVSVLPLGPGTTPLDLRFTGEPADDETPYRGADRPVVAGDMATELEYWWHRLLTLPFPF